MSLELLQDERRCEIAQLHNARAGQELGHLAGQLRGATVEVKKHGLSLRVVLMTELDAVQDSARPAPHTRTVKPFR